MKRSLVLLLVFFVTPSLPTPALAQSAVRPPTMEEIYEQIRPAVEHCIRTYGPNSGYPSFTWETQEERFLECLTILVHVLKRGGVIAHEEDDPLISLGNAPGHG